MGTLCEKLRIMAVDDQPDVLDAYRRILVGERPAASSLDAMQAELFGESAPQATADDVDLELVQQGDEAVAAVERALADNRPFSVIFLDVRMPPGPDGVWTAQQIRALDPSVEVVIVTGFSDVEPEAICARVPPPRQLFYLQKPLNPQEIRQLAVALTEKWRAREATRRAREEIVVRLAAAAEARHHETGAHLRRIGLYAGMLAEACGWERDRVEDLQVAAMMHDAGKIGIPDSILLKPGRLSEPERAVMQGHALIGARILEGSEAAVLHMAREVALYHHEWWDGSGYPFGLQGEAIPESARIVAIADVYDALLHDRVYRPALDEREALQAMARNSGRQFDPKVFARFMELTDEFRRVREQVVSATPPGPSAGAHPSDGCPAGCCPRCPARRPDGSCGAPDARA